MTVTSKLAGPPLDLPTKQDLANTSYGGADAGVIAISPVQPQTSLRRSATTISPFLRWAGSKRWLVPIMHQYQPEHYASYYEPFLGSGSIFFDIEHGHRAHLSDTLAPLINCYSHVRDNPHELTDIALGWEVNEDQYYQVRAQEFDQHSVAAASQFLFLNKACFNGLYRENRSGRFNVPYGRPKTSNVIDHTELTKASIRLQDNVRIEVADFEDALLHCASGDFVYLDPPYSFRSESKTFTQYNSQVFTWDDQRRLASVFTKLSRNGVQVILTNANHPSVRQLYQGFQGFELNRYSSMSGRPGGRGRCSELLFISDGLKRSDK